MLEKIKENKRKLIIVGIIIAIILLIIGIIFINKAGKGNKSKQIAKAEEEYGYDKPYIPEGFIYVEGNWNTGYVIKDIQLGNEFVWIPIDGSTVTELKRRDYITEDTISMESCAETLDEAFEESVKKYGGYYVGRYEAGIPEGKTFQTADEMNTNGKPVTKKGASIWNNIDYENARNKCYSNVWNKSRNNK